MKQLIGLRRLIRMKLADMPLAILRASHYGSSKKKLSNIVNFLTA